MIRAVNVAAANGNWPLACQLIEWVTRASDSTDAWNLRKTIYRRRADAATSAMAKGIYSSAAADYHEEDVTGEVDQR